MRVLWFTNIPMSEMAQHLGLPAPVRGGWMSSLVELVRKQEGVRLAIASAIAGQASSQFSKDGVDYFSLSQSRFFELAAVFTSYRAGRLAKRCAAIVDDWKPDIVHIHGTENFYGLIKSQGLTDVPVVVSIQGLVGQCRKHALGGLSPLEVIRAHRLIQLLTRRGLWGQLRWYKAREDNENRLLRSAEAFMGRTEWDRAHVMAANPQAAYYHVDEVIRRSFFEDDWSLEQCRRNQILTTVGPRPLKGVEVLLDAVGILRQRTADVKLVVAGADYSRKGGYPKLVRRRIQKLGLENHVECLGRVDAEHLVKQLKACHCFVLPSYIENSPNSLCEAMIMGAPCIASYTGGIPSLVKDGQTGLLSAVGDPAMLAANIRRVLADDGLACRLGQEAQQSARQRHNAERIVSDLLRAYEDIISQAGSEDSAAPGAHR